MDVCYLSASVHCMLPPCHTFSIVYIELWCSVVNVDWMEVCKMKKEKNDKEHNTSTSKMIGKRQLKKKEFALLWLCFFVVVVFVLFFIFQSENTNGSKNLCIDNRQSISIAVYFFFFIFLVHCFGSCENVDIFLMRLCACMVNACWQFSLSQ